MLPVTEAPVAYIRYRETASVGSDVVFYKCYVLYIDVP